MCSAPGFEAATEDVPHDTRSRSAQGTGRITLDFHLHRLIGDGRKSIAAQIRTNICPAGS